MWVPANESRASVLAFHDASAAACDEAVEALALDARGAVPWWPEDRRSVTLQQVLVHVIAETARHAGHADIVRELLDGTAGGRPGDPNLPDRPAAQWFTYRAQIEAAARTASERAGEHVDRSS